MQLSTFTDYTLRVLMHLTAAQDQKLTTRQISEIHDAKFNHVAKVTQWLVREGYVSSTRGRSGGLHLIGDPSAITVGKIVRKLEGQDGVAECMRGDGGTCILAPSCELKSALHDAQEAFFRSLDNKTLASLTNGRIDPLLRKLNQSIVT
ncbi:MAG: Rrf2 family transcriptional regulator [Paracoccaceae bacterium]|nr:Rrf2 family transcriptional regulator [Paracoccaceae bacterium]MDG2257357.1 Rrf2 family transcriptional regulator [Paracoccaceae bacterium]